MGLAEFTSIKGWRRLDALAGAVGLANEFAPVEKGLLEIRPFRLFFAVWLLWGWYALVKLFRGWENLPANWLGLYLAILGVIYLVWRLAQSEDVQAALARWLDESSEPQQQPALRNTFAWLAGGLLLVAGNLALLQWRHPQTFTHDDNLSQFLPVIVHGCRSLIDDGVFPTWNPHQFACAPTTSVGTYALTYPPTYLSYCVARHALGNEFLTLEVFGVLHLLAGYLTMFGAARSMGMRPSLAATAGVCFALCGFFLIAGRSWYYMLPLAAWLPLLALSIWNMRDGRLGWGWMLGTGALLGTLFHAGNAQMWFYAVTFIGLAAVYLPLYGGQSWRILVPATCAVFLGAAIAAPLLVPQFVETAGLKRFAGGEPIVRGLTAMFLPWPLASADRPGMAETRYLGYMSQFYYAGTVFTTVAAVGWFSCVFHRWHRRIAGANLLLALALAAFIYALGRPGMMWGLTGELPIFKQFRHPMKYLVYVHLFGILGGGLIVERLLRRHARRWAEGLIAGACALLMSYHTLLALPSFFSWGFYPYPAAPELARELAGRPTARLFPVAPRRSTAANFAESQMLNLPTVYGTYSLVGYDPLIEENPQHQAVRKRLMEQPLEALRAYGVRYVTVYPVQDLPRMPEGHKYFRAYYWEGAEKSVHRATLQHGTLLRAVRGASLYQIEGAAPLAFAKSAPEDELSIQFDAAGADVVLGSTAVDSPQTIIVNVLPPPFLRVLADGRPVPHDTDEWGRLRIQAPAGAARLRLSYVPCWYLGTALGVALAGASVAVFSSFGRLP
jgi:hypothetical protein